MKTNQKSMTLNLDPTYYDTQILNLPHILAFLGNEENPPEVIKCDIVIF